MYQDDTRYRFRVRFHLIKRVFLWTLFIGAVLILGLKSEHDRLQQSFAAEVDRIARHSERTAKTFEVALDGFRRFLAHLPAADLEAARSYAANLRQHYPELRLFAIVQSIDTAGRLTRQDNLEQLGYAGLRLARLVDSGRTLDAGAESAYRLPLVFAEPELNSGSALLEIDRAFNRAVRERDLGRDQQASGSFERQSGPAAYLLFGPVPNNDNVEASVTRPWPQAYSLLVVHIEDLLPADMIGRRGWSLKLLSAATAERPAELLWHQSVQPFRGLASLFGQFNAERRLSGDSQPFLLQFSYRPHWFDFDHQYLGLLVALVLSLVVVATRVISFSHRKNLGEIEEHSSLYRQAHYDHLTGLPNANLLMDRLERGISTLDISRERLVLAYLDLDRFKPVNDRWGHEAGDRMLIEVSRRLRQQFRVQDTVSRIHGDEFIVLLTLPAERVDRAGVEDKVKAAFDEPFVVDGCELNLGCSLGVAVYPEDAAEMEALISVADGRMYQVKECRYEMSPLSI